MQTIKTLGSQTVSVFRCSHLNTIYMTMCENEYLCAKCLRWQKEKESWMKVISVENGKYMKKEHGGKYIPENVEDEFESKRGNLLN